MKWIKFSLLAIVIVGSALALSSWETGEETELKIGDPFPIGASELYNLDGTATTLRQEMKQNGLLVVFSCNTCPFVLQWENRYNELYDLCAANNMGMILINSNEAKRDGDDSLEKMKQKAKDSGYKMPYLMDQNHVVADAFSARTTPHVFLFSRHGALAYRGSIDDNSEDKAAVTQPYLMNAIKAVAEDNAAEPSITKAIGCSIKRVVK